MPRKFRKKTIVVEADQNADGTWNVSLGMNAFELWDNKSFVEAFEEVSPLYRVQPMRLDIAEGAD